MGARFMYLHIMKKYNYFHGMDTYFRELAKVFIELKQEGITYPAENLHKLLNSDFYVTSSTPQTFVEATNFGYKKVSIVK